MKTLIAVVVMIAVAGLSLAPAAFAQSDRSPGSTPAPSRGADKAPRDAFKAPDGVMESSKIIGTKVRDAAGKNLGEIDQILVDSKTGKVTHAVIGRGGLLGVGETKVVVPWSEVNLKADVDNRDRLMVTMEQSMLDAAPRYDRRAAAERPAAPAASPPTTPR
jgi:sporulation protein YlmC with PRC-barrel domain